MPATCLHNGVLCCSSLDGTPYLCMSVKPSEIRLQVSDVIHDTIASVCLLSQTSTNHAQYTKKYKFMIQTGQIIVCASTAQCSDILMTHMPGDFSCSFCCLHKVVV